MVAPAFVSPDHAETFAELLQPDLLIDGAEPERRVVYSGISWERYLSIDKELGDDRAFPRLYYLDSELEMMSTSEEHERLKKWISDLLTVYFEEHGTEIVTRGHATMWLATGKAGAEADDSYCIGEAKKYPDLALEIALTSGGLNKLKLYSRFKIFEVWIWHRNKLEIHSLSKAGEYKQIQKGRLLPGFDAPLLERCLGLPSWQEARRAFRAGISRKAVKHQR